MAGCGSVNVCRWIPGYEQESGCDQICNMINMDRHVLEIDSVMVEIKGRSILSGVYVKAETNEVTGILGRNGSGKSTLFRTIMGDMKCQSAHLSFDGVFMPVEKSKFGILNYLPQNPVIPGYLTLRQAFSDYGVDTDFLTSNFPEFRDVLDVRSRLLSSGERRIAEVIMILFSDSAFSILDEPFSQVMPVNVEKLQELISFQKKSKGIIITDHQYSSLLPISDRVYILDRGNAYLMKEMVDLVRYGYLHRV